MAKTNPKPKTPKAKALETARKLEAANRMESRRKEVLVHAKALTEHSEALIVLCNKAGSKRAAIVRKIDAMDKVWTAMASAGSNVVETVEPTAATRFKVMKDFHNRCAICGSSRLQFHHVDEDHSHNDEDNIIPLCPNCHLGDYHGQGEWTGDPDKVAQMKLFRRSKNPYVWDVRFFPLWGRMAYLRRETVDQTEREHRELVRFIASFQRGDYYAARVRSVLIYPMKNWGEFGPKPGIETNRCSGFKRHHQMNYMIENLVAEMLLFQGWERPRSLVAPPP